MHYFDPKHFEQHIKNVIITIININGKINVSSSYNIPFY